MPPPHPVLVPELIDTLWNVNPGRQEQRLPDNKELIDTLWNVNWLFYTS